MLFSEEHRLRYDFNSEPITEPFKEKYRVEDSKCAGPSYFSVKDEIDTSFKLASTEEFLTKWKVIDDAKYRGYGEDWFANLQFKYEIIVLSVVAMGILF